MMRTTGLLISHNFIGSVFQGFEPDFAGAYFGT
jgi:hypothetical protein